MQIYESIIPLLPSRIHLDKISTDRDRSRRHSHTHWLSRLARSDVRVPTECRKANYSPPAKSILSFCNKILPGQDT